MQKLIDQSKLIRGNAYNTDNEIDVGEEFNNPQNKIHVSKHYSFRPQEIVDFLNKF